MVRVVSDWQRSSLIRKNKISVFSSRLAAHALFSFQILVSIYMLVS